jgi:tRNA(Ile)-lysidine synthase
MTILTKFKDFIATEQLFTAGERLLLAVSGGLDSVVLCSLCKQAGFDFVMAHCNFQLRGAESERDEAFVRKLAATLEQTLLVKRFETSSYAGTKKISIQEAARELRYSWFDEIMQQGVAPQLTNDLPTRLLTAHHLDDNIETMLMNFFKGTGIAGLRGILPLQGRLARPLLFAKKQDLREYAEANALEWVEDSSNASDKYSRNYFRNQLIPMVQQVFPAAESNLADNLQRFRDIETLYYQSIATHKSKLIVYNGDELHIPALKLKKAQPLNSIVYEIIKEVGFTAAQVPAVIELLDSETGKYICSSSHRIIKNRQWIIIVRLHAPDNNVFVLDEPGSTTFELGELIVKADLPVPADIPVDAVIACLDAAAVKFPLLLRKWKTGDYFYPLGMKKKKKLGRFFIDAKLSKTQKEKIWVIESGKKIVWVIGYRIDERCKITASTRQILQLSLKPKD